MRKICKGMACACALASFASVALAAGDSGFLTDASLLKPAATGGYAKTYLAPDAKTAVKSVVGVMIDQPEIFISGDSKYKGAKPDDLKIIADGLRTTLQQELGSGYKVVDKAAPGVLFIRTAISDVELEKKKRPILAYIPVGAVVYAAKNLASNVTSKVNLKNAVFEAEVLDSASGNVIAAATEARNLTGSDPQQEQMSWDALEGMFTVAARRLRCRLDAAGKSEAEWAQCAQVELEKPAQKS
jgi:hypothetical protein